MRKPERLYHASRHRDLDVIEPRQVSARDPAEGQKVFAALDRRFVSVFLNHIPGAESGYINGVPYFAAEREAFLATDVGGAIYDLPADSFDTDPVKGLGTREWTSSVSVAPIAKETHERALEAMIQSGVQVYLVDAETMTRIQADVKGRPEFLRTLISENQARGEQVVSFGVERGEENIEE